MRYDADYFTIETFIDKFKKLLDDRYGELKPHKRRNAFIKDYDMKYNVSEHTEPKSIENTVKQWFGISQRPSIEKLMNICELLDCDIDYFLTPQEEFKREISQASTVTGLNYDSIDKICKTSPIQKTIFDNLILHTHFNDWLFSIYEFTHSHNIITTTINTGIFADTGNAENHSYTKNALKYRVTDLLGDIIEDIYKKNTQKENEKLALKCFTELIYAIDEAITNHFIYYDNETGELQTQSRTDFTKFVQKELAYINNLTNNQVKLYQFEPSVYIDNISRFKDAL